MIFYCHTLHILIKALVFLFLSLKVSWYFPVFFSALQTIWQRWGWEGEGWGGGIVFASGREMKIFSTVFRDFGKNMVRKRYFKPQMVPVNTEKKNKKKNTKKPKKPREIGIWTSFKKVLFWFQHFSGKQTLTYFYNSLILETW